MLIRTVKHWVKNLPLRMKLILPTWLLMTFGLVCSGVAIIHVVGDELERSLLSRAELLANSAASNITPVLTYENKIIILEQLSDYTYDPDVVAAILTQINGAQFVKLKRLPKDCKPAFNAINCDSDSLIKIVKPIVLGDEILGHIELFISLEGVKKEHRRLLGFLMIETVFFSLLAWFFARLIHRFVTDPLSSLHRSMSHIIRRCYLSKPIPIKHNDELGQLAECFNDMVISLADRDDKLNATLTQLEEKNRYIFQMLDAMEQGVLVIAPGDLVTYYNPSAKKMLGAVGCDPGDLKQIIQMLAPNILMNQLSQAIDEHVPLNAVEIFHEETGKIYRVRTVPMATERHSLVQFEDITLFHVSEHRRKFAELIFDQNQNALLVVSRAFQVQAQNTVCVNTFGCLTCWSDILFSDDFHVNFSQVKTLLLVGNYQWYTTLISTRGVHLPCRISAQKVANRNGKTEAFIVSIIDQTLTLELERLNHVANHDPLTGLANRVHAMDKLARDHENGCNMHVLFVDLDGFKSVNDKFGHHVGDELLKVVARRLVSNVSCNDFVARLSGDEFLLALNDPHDVVIIVKRLLAKLNETIHVNGVMPKISASIGICPWSALDDTPLNAVIESADKAMYEAKASGKNCFSMASLPELEWVL